MPDCALFQPQQAPLGCLPHSLAERGFLQTCSLRLRAAADEPVGLASSHLKELLLLPPQSWHPPKMPPQLPCGEGLQGYMQYLPAVKPLPRSGLYLSSLPTHPRNTPPWSPLQAQLRGPRGSLEVEPERTGCQGPEPSP